MFCPIQALNDTLEILDSAAGSCQKENARMNPMDAHPAPNSRTTDREKQKQKKGILCLVADRIAERTCEWHLDT